MSEKWRDDLAEDELLICLDIAASMAGDPRPRSTFSQAANAIRSLHSDLAAAQEELSQEVRKRIETEERLALVVNANGPALAAAQSELELALEMLERISDKTGKLPGESADEAVFRVLAARDEELGAFRSESVQGFLKVCADLAKMRERAEAAERELVADAHELERLLNEVDKWQRKAEEAARDAERLNEYLDGLPNGITSWNIGNIRKSLFLPFDCSWNALVRDETAKRESAAIAAKGEK